MGKKPLHRAIRLEEAIAELRHAERIVAQLQSSDVLQAFTDIQRTHYYAVLLLLRELLRDPSQDNSREQIAS
jgi:hypothetical protein